MTEYTHIQLKPHDHVPSGHDITGNGAVPVLRHNVLDLVDGLPEDVGNHLDSHYGPRAPHHLPASRYGDMSVQPVTAKDLNKALPLASWNTRKYGIQYVLSSLSDAGDTHPLSEHDVLHVPYYVNRKYEGTQYWGPHPIHSEKLKNKAEFSLALQERNSYYSRYCEKHDIYPNVVLPFKIVSADDISEAISTRLEEIDTMYKSIEAYTGEIDYPRGLVVQQIKGDGGYGTVILKEDKENERWVVMEDKHRKEYDTYIEAHERVAELTGNTGGHFKITRYIDLVDSPSVGVYVDKDAVLAMPVTLQLMDEGSCVGGCSQTATDNLNPEIVQKEKFLRGLSEIIIADMVAPDGKQGHFGLDYMLTGEKEKKLREAIQAHADLHQYAHEVVEVGIAECNPRFTSLSLSVWPTVAYLKREQIENALLHGASKADVEKLRKVTYEDVMLMYGHENSAGERGGFAVWDFMGCPDGVVDEKGLLEWIDSANDQLQDDGIFFLPRLYVEDSVTSVVLGLKPTANQESHAQFKHIVGVLNKTRSLSTL